MPLECRLEVAMGLTETARELALAALAGMRDPCFSAKMPPADVRDCACVLMKRARLLDARAPTPAQAQR